MYGSRYIQANDGFIRYTDSFDSIGDRPPRYSQVTTISKSGLKALDQPSERCESGTSDPNTSTCIARYIENQIGCSMNIHGGGSTELLPCKSRTEQDAFINSTKKLQEANANTIYEQTGCLASCERNEYIIVDSSFKNREHSVSSQTDHILDYELYLEFNILTGSHKEEEQYVIYDSNSFIADVGGFLGLLLGYSALGLYDEFVSLLSAL